MNYSLNNVLCCTNQVHSHLLFGQFLHGLKSSIIGGVPIFHNCMDWKGTHRLILTFKIENAEKKTDKQADKQTDRRDATYRCFEEDQIATDNMT